MRRKACALLLAVMLAAPVWAGVGSSSGVEFLRLGAGARPLAMGEAYTAYGNDISSMYYNPAGLAQINYPEAVSMTNDWFDTIGQVVFGVGIPSRWGVFGIGYSALSSGDIQGYDDTGGVTSVFSTASSCVNLSFGRRINDKLTLGLGVKTISDRLENSSASAYAFDAGLQYRFNGNLIAGASAMNFGSGLTYIAQTTPLPTSYRAGLAWQTELFGEDISLAGDLVSYPEGVKINEGIEYVIRDLLALRGGMSGGVARVGLGVLTNLVSFDYAYRAGDDYLSATHQFSLGFLFGAPELAKKKFLEEAALGKAYLNAEKYTDAILHFERAVELDPKNEEASLLLRKAQVSLEEAALRQVFAQKEEESKRTIDEIRASGKSYFDKGLYLEALAEYNKILRIDPQDKDAVKMQGQAQYQLESKVVRQSKDEAKEALGEALKQVAVNNYAEALKQVELALSKDPKNKEAQALKDKLRFILKLESE